MSNSNNSGVVNLGADDSAMIESVTDVRHTDPERQPRRNLFHVVCLQDRRDSMQDAPLTQ